MDIVEVEELILKLSRVVENKCRSTSVTSTRSLDNSDSNDSGVCSSTEFNDDNRISNNYISNNYSSLYNFSRDAIVMKMVEEKNQEMKTRILIVESKLSRLEMEMIKYKEDTFGKRNV